ncbi:glycosyltransferase [Methanobacterium subterraneum]|jgi:glycosyltransferase involved in cell wall biosynthesis|uniref:Family 2 glycosyl transferase n=1 Tax=Methanobacterium subterraneum TaxID=59277 RepID=A0A7K4DKM6_9EURY|nr:glycosyltransferase [Methanobacterium subterraneum]NMO09037.1 family 2 glycosyl transferase [Methanobacterium subterraneum]
MITVVCVYNNQEILDNLLLKSLKTQSLDYELILMDNTNNHFKSAAEALNQGAKKANGSYMMFVHQDIDLKSDEWLKNTESTLNSLDNLGVAGVAGVSPWDEDEKISNIKQGSPPRRISDNHIETPQKVQTVDECLFIIPKSVFDILKFDEEVCDDWHLYAADYCLSAINMGLNVFVIPSEVYHSSPGNSMSDKYYTTLGNILKKHKKYHRFIFTTMGGWTSFYPLYIQKKRPYVKKKLLAIFQKIYQSEK